MYTPVDNLQNLHWQMTRHVAVIVIVIGVIGCWMTVISSLLNAGTFLSLLLLTIISVIVSREGGRNIALARQVLIWSLMLWLTGLLLFNTDARWAYMIVPGVIASIVLLTHKGAIPVLVVAVVMIALAASGARDYRLGEVFLLMALAGVLSWVTVETLYTSLHWTQVSQQRVSVLLNETLKNRTEMLETLKSLEATNRVLRRTQEELKAARQRAEEAGQLKERFAANISHELRTPLNLILGFTEVMHLTPDVYGMENWSPTLRRDIYQIFRSSRHLLSMIDDILDLSRFEISGFTLNMEPTSIEALLLDSVDIGRSLFRDGRVSLEVDIAPDLPTVKLDRTRIRQVLLNLINNAHRFTDSGYVRITARCQDQEIVISVEDTGRGIPRDKIQFIFDEFYQANYSLSRKHGGAGLGLAICKRFVESHGGRISVQSAVDAGSVFTFTIPCATGATQVESDLPASIRQTEGYSVLLVVDPDPAVHQLIQRGIPGSQVVPVENVDQLAWLVSEYQPTAIVHNVVPEPSPTLPFELSEPVPVIQCSLPSRAWIERELDVFTSISKPVTVEELLKVVGEVPGACRILVIDDDRGFTQFVERALHTSDNSYSVQRAYTGEEGLLQMRAEPPDLVLLDLTMPDVSGYTILKAMRESSQLADIPVILLTATSYADEIFSRRSNRITVERTGSTSIPDLLNTIQAIAATIHPPRTTVDQTVP
jgi:signal transduction histidine kinase/CheY-like chemotaxis protein